MPSPGVWPLRRRTAKMLPFWPWRRRHMRRGAVWGLWVGTLVSILRVGWCQTRWRMVEIWTELTHGKGFKDKLNAKRQSIYRRKDYTGTITVYGRCPWKDRLLGSFMHYPVGVFKKESVSNVERSAKPPPPVLDLLVWHKATHTKACQQLKALMPMMLSIRYSYREHWKTLLTLATWAVSACKNARVFRMPAVFFPLEPCLL